MPRLLPTVATLSGLYLLKQYFNGATCQPRRDLSGQVAIITGGNSGIGRQTALGLAKQNCSVVITGRDKVKCEEAVKYLKEMSGNSDIQWKELDLADKESVEGFVRGIKEKYNKVNVLVNNAGIAHTPELTLNKQGLEIQMATNHFGHFYLTYMLWDILRKSENLRIVNVSSRAHLSNALDSKRKVQIDFSNLDGKKNYDGSYQYSVTKLANVLFTQQLAERLNTVNPDARVISLHPGLVRTDVFRYFVVGWKKVAAIALYPLLYLVSKDTTQGAQTTLYGVFQDKDILRNGAYYDECKESKINPFAKNPENQKKLWEGSEELLGIKFPAN